ncbi:MAG TPA: alpha/beta fold hydrolase [Solirubrobacteraceae bacterium]
MPAPPVQMVGRRLLAAALTAVAALAVLPASAPGALKWRSCEGEQGFECAILRVPLDRSGAVPGTVPLHITRERRQVRGGRVYVSLLGGPGQGGVAAAPFIADSMAPALLRHRLVVIDQRGTGNSGVLRCRHLQRLRLLNPVTATLSAQCATELGERRQFYATADSVADLEDVRQALGVDKLAIQGTSYGTYVAQQYARMYPDHVESLVLDSVVGPEGVDPFLTESWGATPRILRENCADDACRGITEDPVADLRALAAALDAKRLKGVVIDGSGRGHPTQLGAVGLATVLVEGDLNSHLRAAIPGAIRAGVQGDAAPLLRLIRPAVGPAVGLRDLSWGLFAATTCADNRLPYPLETPIPDRPAKIAEALAAIPDEELGPFNRGLVERMSAAEQCRLWPPGRAVLPSSNPLPDVPALILNGRLDLRTPLENAQAVAAQLPHATLIPVPGNGHDEIDTDLSGCVARALFRFFTNRRIGEACIRTSNAVPPAPLPPATFKALDPHRGAPGDLGRVLRAAVETVLDVRESFYMTADAGLQATRGGGLRAGTWRTQGQTGFVLRGVAWAPEVKVTGRVTSRLGRFDGTVRVRAPEGLSGHLRFVRGHGVTGVLGGRRVHLPARAVRGAVEPALVHVLG